MHLPIIYMHLYAFRGAMTKPTGYPPPPLADGSANRRKPCSRDVTDAVPPSKQLETGAALTLIRQRV